MPYPTLGASNRLRIEQYAPLLVREDISLQVSPYLTDRTYRVLYRAGYTGEKALGVARGALRRLVDVLRARRFDLVVVHRESAPLGPPLVERALARLRIPYVLDFDDAIFLPAVHPANRRWGWIRPAGRLAESARLAAAVIAGNEYLASHARAWNSRVTVIPTPVDTERHRPATTTSGGPTVIGWIGSSTTAPYLRLVDRPLATICAESGVELRIIGGDYQNRHIPRLDVRPYDLEREPRDLQEFDVGILPEPDDPWTRGKGAFKALLYMATGLPVVASAVGVNCVVVVDGVTGYCVSSDDEWRDALRRLVRDPALRRRLGAAGRERAERLYSLHVLAPRFAAVLRAAARLS